MLAKFKAKLYECLRRKLDFVTFTKLWTVYINNFMKEKNYYAAYVVSKCKSKDRYFIVRMTCPLMGPGAVIRNFILIASWAEKNGWIPILDWEYGSTYLEGKMGVDNFQELFFDSKISIEDIVNGHYAIAGTINKVDVYDNDNHFIKENIKSPYCRPDDEYSVEYYKTFKYYLDKYFRLGPDIIRECNEEYEFIINNSKNTVAIMLRELFSEEGKEHYNGTEMENILKKHPTSISVDDAIEKADYYMKKWGCKYIFVSSMMQETKEKFQKRFDDAVVFIDRVRLEWSKPTAVPIYSSKETQINHKDTLIEKYRSYLKEIYLSSLCGYLLGAPSTGVTLALSINDGKYKDKYIFEEYTGVEVEVSK